MEYFKFKNNLSPQKGDFLLSEPFMSDQNFVRSVIYLCECTDEEVIGLIINKPLGIKLSEIVSVNMNSNSNVFFGGPVGHDTLHVIFLDSVRTDLQLPEHTLGLNADELQENIDSDLPNAGNETSRFFLGYTGWSREQLSREIDENSWIIYRTKERMELFFLDNEQLWSTILTKMGGRYKLYAKYPIDPQLN